MSILRMASPGRLVAYAGLVGAALVGGAWGTYQYAEQYATYRGFGPPEATVPPNERGQLVSFELTSSALGGRTARVWVYLPVAYRTHRNRRFPSIYLLQGMPGTGYTAYVNAFHIAPTLDEDIAEHKLQPMIAVIPPGTWSGRSPATEWADGPRPGSQWDTFLTRDVVNAIDSRFRTIADPASRGVGGYSAGANEAANAVILHPGVFGVAETWSGDFTQTPSLVDNDPTAISRYTALDTVPSALPDLRAEGTKFLIYVGSEDHDYRKSIRFVSELRTGGIRPTFILAQGGHSWRLWHDELPTALAFFSRNLRSTPCTSCTRPATRRLPCFLSPAGVGSNSSTPSHCPAPGSSTRSRSMRALGATTCRSLHSSPSGRSSRHSPASRTVRGSAASRRFCWAPPSSRSRPSSKQPRSIWRAKPRLGSTSRQGSRTSFRGSRADSAQA